MAVFELNRLISYDDEALLAELRRVATLVDSPFLTRRVFEKYSKASSSTICHRFGDWRQALAAAGLESRHTGRPEAWKLINQKFTDKELLSELRLVSEKMGGKPVTADEFNRFAKFNATTLRRRFGSWGAALKKASLQSSRHGKRYSDDDYFENLLAVWTHHGRQPNYSEMNCPPSGITVSAYERKWGTWRKALIAFLERVDSDAKQQESDASSTPEDEPHTEIRQHQIRQPRRRAEEDQRKIKLGLRYEILKRDRFRCVRCGTSPATLLGCVLHVDHIVAFSRGGKTIRENLRTLCESCNLGKGAKLEGNAAANSASSDDAG
jgi:hypothetical protein